MNEPTIPASWRSTFLSWAIAAAVASPFCFNAVQETDVGWHIALGRRILERGTIPRTNALTWTAPEHPYYATSWLFDVVAARAEAVAGPLGLQLLTCAFLLATLAGLVVACRPLHRWAPWVAPPIALLLVPRVTPRPHMATWVIEAGVLAAGVLGRERWRWRAAAIPLVAVGSNLHSGAVFAVGLLGLFSLEAAWREQQWRREIAICALAIAALLANPGGIYNLEYVFGNLSVYSRLPVNEMKPPLMRDLPAFFALIPLAGVSAAAQLRKRPSMLPMVLVFAGLGLFAVRQAFDFYLIAAVALAGALPWMEERSGRRGVALSFAMLVTLSAASIMVRVPLLSPRAAWDERMLPVRAAHYVADRKLGDHGFNSFADGGFLEYAVPGLRTYQDGRVQAFPPAFFDEEIAAYESPETFAAHLRHKDIEWALTGAGEPALLDRGWRLVYWDDLNEIFVRGDVPRLSGLLARDEIRFYVPTSSPENLVKLAAVLQPDAERQMLSEVDRFLQQRPEDAAASLVRCAALTRLGATEAQAACDAAQRLLPATSWEPLLATAQATQAARP